MNFKYFGAFYDYYQKHCVKGPREEAALALEKYFSNVSEDERQCLLSIKEKNWRPHLELEIANINHIDQIYYCGIFEKWVEEEPTDYRLHRWLGVYQYGGMEHLKKALELKPDDQISIISLVNIYLHGFNYITHELSCNALLCPLEEALEDLKHAQYLIDRIDNKEHQQERQKICTKYAKLINIFAKYDQLKPDTPFFEWAAKEEGYDDFS